MVQYIKTILTISSSLTSLTINSPVLSMLMVLMTLKSMMPSSVTLMQVELTLTSSMKR